jgi:hypothetical protein
LRRSKQASLLEEDGMTALRRGLVDTVKKAAAKVGTRGVQVAAKAGTRGARALVETTAAAVKTVDKLQAKLGRRPRKSATSTQEPMVAERKSGTATQSKPRTAAPMVNKDTSTQAPEASAKSVGGTAMKSRRATTQRTPEALPVELREAGRKTMPAAAPKRSKQAKPTGPQFKVKRGQKHRHTGR